MVLENVYDLGNANAVWRTAEALGIHCIHHIEQSIPEATNSSHRKLANRVSQGANNWLHIQKWDESANCLQGLKKQGYQIALTSPETHPKSFFLQDVNFQKPTAIVFGNEHKGISQEARACGDIFIKIPLYGFVQSYNLSVAAALILYNARIQWPEQGDLNSTEQKILQAFCYTKSLKGLRGKKIGSSEESVGNLLVKMP